MPPCLVGCAPNTAEARWQRLCTQLLRKHIAVFGAWFSSIVDKIPGGILHSAQSMKAYLTYEDSLALHTSALVGQFVVHSFPPLGLELVGGSLPVAAGLESEDL